MCRPNTGMLLLILWVPARAKKWLGLDGKIGKWLLKRGNKWNGNYVSPQQHFKHDPFRFPKGWADLGEKFPKWLQQVDRIPNVFKGAGIGGGAAGASANARGD